MTAGGLAPSDAGAGRAEASLADALRPWLARGAGVVALVGAGGKTSALFRLARDLEEAGLPVLATTTTRLADPREEPPPFPVTLLVRPSCARPWQGEPVPPAGGGTTLLVSGVGEPAGKAAGVHPSWVPALRGAWPFVLVEADGSRRLPVKAPAAHEPVLPPGTDVVLGVMGLRALGRPMDEAVVHRPDRFAAVTGCAPGAPIRWEHLAALARHPDGLFKGAGAARRVVLLVQADRAAAPPPSDALRGLAADLVLVASFEGPARASFALLAREAP